MSVFVPSGLRVAQEVRYGASSQTLTWICEVDGHRVTPGASPSVRVFKPGQVEDADAQITGTGTVSGTSITYALDASDTNVFALGRGYRAKATWTNGGKTYTTTIAFLVVRNPVNAQIPVNENDLLSAHVRVEEALNQVARLGYSGGHYIQEAWNEVVRYLVATHKVPAEALPRDDLGAMVLPLARHKLFMSLFATQGDTWHTLAMAAREEYEEAKRNTPVHFAHGDTNQGEMERGWQQPETSAGPDYFAVRRGGVSYGRR